jgi:hypothetical protein
MGDIKIKDPQNARDDNDSQLPGDGYAGDGLSNYEEYRGFLVVGKHLRTNIDRKDVFVHNPNSLNLNLQAFQSALGVIAVHVINEKEYIDNSSREINFNFDPNLHYTPPAGEEFRIQKGLLIKKANTAEQGLLGYTFAIPPHPDEPGPPNWILRSDIYTANIQNFSTRMGVNLADKTNQVCAHELCHALNVYHHGTGTNDAKGRNTCHGLRSGSMDCIMRYDNLTPTVKGFIPEQIGNILCNSRTGTGYNAHEQCVLPADPDAQNGPANISFGNAAAKHGNCIGQIRISCRTSKFPKRP